MALPGERVKDQQTSLCPYCRMLLDESGQPAEPGDKHAPYCADRSLEQSELKGLFRYRPGEPRKTETRTDTGRVEWEAYQVAPEEDLRTILASRCMTSAISGLLRELAALVRIADPTHAVAFDRAGKYRDIHSPMPSFTSAQAGERLAESENRLVEEVLLLSGATRNPHDPQEPQCVDCGRRATVVDSYCRPCGAAILQAHRRGA